MQKHILMIAQTNFNYDTRIIRYITTLKENDFKVSVICLRYNHQAKYEEMFGVKVYRIMNSFSHDSIISYLFYSFIFLLKSFLKCIRLAIKENFSLLHIHNMPDYLVFAGTFLKIKQIPIILDIHDLTPELFKERWSEKKYRLLRPFLEFVEKISCRFANHVITVTPECVRLLENRGIIMEKISLIMNSADEKMFKYSDERFNKNGSAKFKFVYHGTIAKRFGLHFFIKSFPKVLKAVPGVEFHLIGSFNNAYADELKKLIQELELSENVFLKKHLDSSELNQTLKQYDLGVVTYESSEYMNLALPTKAGEYALTGVPFIISELNTVKSIFRNESVCYVDPENTEILANEAIDLLRDPKRRHDMSLNAHEDMKKISWNVMEVRYLKLIDSLLIN